MGHKDLNRAQPIPQEHALATWQGGKKELDCQRHVSVVVPDIGCATKGKAGSQEAPYGYLSFQLPRDQKVVGFPEMLPQLLSDITSLWSTERLRK